MIFYEFTSDPKLKVGSGYSYRLRDEIRKATLKEYNDCYLKPYTDHLGKRWSDYGLTIPIYWYLMRSNVNSPKLIKKIWCDKTPRLLPNYFYDIS
jgi:hypothetical protein